MHIASCSPLFSAQSEARVRMPHRAPPRCRKTDIRADRCRMSHPEPPRRRPAASPRRMACLKGSASTAGALLAMRRMYAPAEHSCMLSSEQQHVARFIGADGDAKGDLALEGLRWNDKAKFEWNVVTSYGSWRSVVALRCDHAVERGVVTPECWSEIVQCAVVDSKSMEASGNVTAGPDLAEIRCLFLGAPIRAAPADGPGLAPGVIVRLKENAMRFGAAGSSLRT